MPIVGMAEVVDRVADSLHIPVRMVAEEVHRIDKNDLRHQGKAWEAPGVHAVAAVVEVAAAVVDSKLMIDFVVPTTPFVLA